MECNETGRQMSNMFKTAKEKLSRYSPDEICRKAGVLYNKTEQMFYIRSFAGDLKLRYPDYDPEPEITDTRGMWYCLTMLQYLDTAGRTLQ